MAHQPIPESAHLLLPVFRCAPDRSQRDHFPHWSDGSGLSSVATIRLLTIHDAESILPNIVNKPCDTGCAVVPSCDSGQPVFFPWVTAMQAYFHKFSIAAADAVGSAPAFLAAVLLIVIWSLTGPLFQYSDTWQLVINTTTSVVTFLMVFLIQNTQNRDTRVLQLKLDELLRSVEGARTGLVRLEDLSDDAIRKLQKEFERLSAQEPTMECEEVDAAQDEPAEQSADQSAQPAAAIVTGAPAPAAKPGR